MVGDHDLSTALVWPWPVAGDGLCREPPHDLHDQGQCRTTRRKAGFLRVTMPATAAVLSVLMRLPIDIDPALSLSRQRPGPRLRDCADAIARLGAGCRRRSRATMVRMRPE